MAIKVLSTTDILGATFQTGSPRLTVGAAAEVSQLNFQYSSNYSFTSYSSQLFLSTGNNGVFTVGVPTSGNTSNLRVQGYVDANNFKINGAQGSDGQVLTSTGSGVAWESVSSSGGDITAVIAGAGLTGGSSSGDATLNLDIDGTNNYIEMNNAYTPASGDFIPFSDIADGTGNGDDNVVRKTTFSNFPQTTMPSIKLTSIAGTSPSNTSNSQVYVPIVNTTTGVIEDWTYLNRTYSGILTVTGSSGLTGTGTFGANQSSNTTITLSHSDTSSQSSVNNSNGTVIQDVTLDTYGHVTALGSVNLDGRYFTETEADARYVTVAGNSQSITGSKIFTHADGIKVQSGNQGNAIRLYTENYGSQIADSFSGNTVKSYIYFDAQTSSNDPGYIMHETSASESNEGVLHLVPSDDNSTGDYVSIHGTNDPDVLKLHTSGLVETVNLQLQLKSGLNEIYLNDGIIVSGASTFQNNVTIDGSGSSGNAFSVDRGSDGAGAFRVQNTGEVVTSANYFYAASSGTSMYVQNTAVFRGSIINDGSGAPVRINDTLQVDNSLNVTGLTKSTTGFSTDGNNKFYTWRALENTAGSSNQYYRIARITAGQSSRFIIELAGRSSSYGDTSLPAFGKIVGQLNNDNNYDIVYYNASATDEVVDEVGQVDVSTTATDIYVRVGQFSELTATAHISDGTITPYDTNSASTSAPSGYVQATEYKLWNAGNDGSGSGLDADTLDGNHASAFLTQHPGISAASSSNNSGRTYIQDITLDSNGHVTGIGTATETVTNTDTNNYLSSASFNTGNGVITFNRNGLSAVTVDIDNRYAYYDHIRSLGTPAFTNGSNPNITTTQLISEIESDGGFDSRTSVFKTSWSYAGNYNLTDAGRFTETAGTSWITWTDNSSDTTRGNITAMAICPTTGGSSGKVFIYNDQGSSYSPGWREVWTNTSDGSGSGLDADLLDGQQGSHYLNYNNLTNTPTIPSVGNGTLTVQGTGALGGSGTFTANQSGNTTISISHDDTSSQGSVNNSGNTVIQDVTLDGYGHVTGLTSKSLSIPSALTETSSGNRYGVNAFVGSDGVMEIGRYIDFHTSDGSTSDYAHRLTVTGSTLYHSAGISGTSAAFSSTCDFNSHVDFAFSSGSKGTRIETASTAIQTLRCDSDRFRFYMGGGSGEVFTIEQSGKIGIKDSTPDYPLDVNHNVSNTSIYASHDIVAYSDIRVKKDIETIPDALDKVNKLRGVTYKRTDEGSTDRTMMGVIAQEVEEVIPEVVSTKESDGHKAVAYGNMVGVLIEAVKELTEKVRILEEKLKDK